MIADKPGYLLLLILLLGPPMLALIGLYAYAIMMISQFYFEPPMSIALPIFLGPALLAPLGDASRDLPGWARVLSVPIMGLIGLVAAWWFVWCCTLFYSTCGMGIWGIPFGFALFILPAWFCSK